MSLGRLSVSLLALGMGTVRTYAATESAVQLPDFAVEGDMPQTRLPYDQLRDMQATAREHYQTFALESYTVVKYPRSRATAGVKSLIRNSEGRVVADITDERGVYEISDKYAGLFASSNQPSEQSGLFFLLQTSRDPTGITLGFLEKLFTEYSDFINRRLEFVQYRYQAPDKNEFKELYQLVVPDEVVVVAATEESAVKIAAKLSVKADGRGVRLSTKQINELVGRLGRAFRLAEDPAAIDCVSPWRSSESQPVTREHCALLAVGWAIYRAHFFSPYRYEVIIPAIVNPRSK